MGILQLVTSLSLSPFHLGLELSVHSAVEEPIILTAPLSLSPQTCPSGGRSESPRKTKDPLLEQTIPSNQLL